MKKLLCVLMAVMAIGFCFVGCVNHDDDKCDECGNKETVLYPVETWVDAKEELCSKCAIEKYGKEIIDKAMENLKIDD